MKRSCVLQPSKGVSQFNKLKKQLGYSKAVDVFLVAINPKFKQDYKDSLQLDSQGVPTIQSILSNEYIQGLINQDQIAGIYSQDYVPMEDTIDNFETIMNQTYQFNTTSEHNDKFIAVMQRNDDGKIQTRIVPRTQQNIDKYNNDYSTFKLNQRISQILGSLGINIGTLYDYEFQAGRVGVTDFSKAKGMAQDFSSIIRVANNVAGAKSISEEFSHLMIGVFRNENFIQRSLNYLKQNEDILKFILGDEYEDTLQFHDNDMESVAEEALGRVLQDNLIDYHPGKETLLERTLAYIRDKFKGYDYSEIEKAIIYADSEMKQFAKRVLEKEVEIQSQDIENSYREKQFNSLAQRLERNIKILQGGINTEIQRYSITKNSDTKQQIGAKINLLRDLKDNQHVLEGICRYALGAVEELKRLNTRLDALTKAGNTGTMMEYKFQVLRQVRSYTQSYGQFISDINDALTEDDLEYESLTQTERDEDLLEWMRNEITIVDKDGEEQKIDMRQTIAEINQLSRSLNSKFTKIGTPLFCETLRPFLPEGFVDKNGDKITVEDLMKSANDISWFDKWLDPMGDSSSLLLQLIDAQVKDARTKARLETIVYIRREQALMKEFEDAGIREYKWMFEIDHNGNKSGNYITAVNHAEYQLQKQLKIQELHEKYGDKPKGDDAKAFKQELREWRKENAVNEFSDIPNPVKYRNEQFFNIKEHDKTRYDLYMKFIALKKEIDDKLGASAPDLFVAIQKRKDGLQRIADSTKSAGELWENIKQIEKERWTDSEDDDQIFGETSKKALLDFDGHEFMKLPTLYVARLKNPNEISEDIFSSLMSYTYSSCIFEQMDNIVDGLEVGRALINDRENFDVYETRGGKQVMQKLKFYGDAYKQNAKKIESNLIQKLNEFYESHVYMRYLKDQGEFLGINVNKGTSRLLEYASLAQLGFNFLANIANVATGKSMQRIEAISGEYFGYKELLDADKEYAAQLPKFISEMGNRVKSSKLYLFDQLFDVKQTFDRTVKQSQYKNVIKRLFGEQFAFFGQEMGDHWLYSRSAIAMAKRQRVLKDGKEMSLWDALQVSTDKNGIPYLDMDNITNTDGSAFNINEFQRMVANVNQGLFGVYNTEDSNAANRVALGRLLQQYRKWIKPQMNKRFMGKQYNIALQREQEGYYRTLIRLIYDGIRGKQQIGTWFKDLSDMEKRNLRRVLAEMVQFMALALCVKIIDWPDDKDRSRWLKLAEYIAKREVHELGGLAPSPIMIQEQLKNLKTPIPALSAVQNFINLGISTFDPEDWFDEIQSGPYKGMSTYRKNWIKAPIPGVAQYRMIDKFVNELDNSINYYARPY